MVVGFGVKNSKGNIKKVMTGIISGDVNDNVTVNSIL